MRERRDWDRQMGAPEVAHLAAVSRATPQGADDGVTHLHGVVAAPAGPSST
ncbi:MAG: hypothetical protein U5K81_10990 [Trueperaceae bacterium]|nr:hypothetical protein [Trueperaceae bacterium]